MVLSFINCKDQAGPKAFFVGRDRLNYSTSDRELYNKFKSDTKLRDFHQLIHAFISHQVLQARAITK